MAFKPTTYTLAEAEATRIAISEYRDVPIYRLPSGKYTLDKPTPKRSVDGPITPHNTIAAAVKPTN